jgi:hypothetical protein
MRTFCLHQLCAVTTCAARVRPTELRQRRGGTTRSQVRGVDHRDATGQVALGWGPPGQSRQRVARPGGQPIPQAGRRGHAARVGVHHEEVGRRPVHHRPRWVGAHLDRPQHRPAARVEYALRRRCAAPLPGGELAVAADRLRRRPAAARTTRRSRCWMGQCFRAHQSARATCSKRGWHKAKRREGATLDYVRGRSSHRAWERSPAPVGWAHTPAQGERTCYARSRLYAT